MALSDLIASVRALQQAHEQLEAAKLRKIKVQAELADVNDEISRAQTTLQAAKAAAKQIANQEL